MKISLHFYIRSLRLHKHYMWSWNSSPGLCNSRAHSLNLHFTLPRGKMTVQGGREDEDHGGTIEPE